jgi:peptidoglycan-associated lipoprotein
MTDPRHTPLRPLAAALAIAALSLAAACQSTPKPAPGAGSGAGEAASVDTGPAAPGAVAEAPRALPPIDQRQDVQAAPGAGSSVPLAAAPADDGPGGPAAALAALGDRVFFETDQHTLTEAAQETLRRQAAWLSARPSLRILIAGNCDERGTREYNLALGARRANAARDYLASLGIDPSRIETVSYGKERPIDERPSSEGWAINRNAHTSLAGAASS